MPDHSQEDNKADNRLTAFNYRTGLIGVFLLVLLIMLFFYKPYVIDRLEPAGGDKMASIAQGKFNNDYRAKTGEIPLWNPAIFCGVPTYYATWPNSFNIDYLIGKIGKVIDWKLSWFTLALIGLLLIFQLLEIPWYYSLAGVLAFLFYPHYQALITVGHFAKVRAVCAMPLVVFGFMNLIKKRNLLSFLWFAIFFSLQLRTQHYQIIFYTLLLLMAIGIWQIVIWIKTAQPQKIGVAFALFTPALGLAVLMSAQPLFVANEYTPYSTRGGQAINLKAEPEQEMVKSSGVTFEYATRWSFHPKELATLIVPRFYGGTSQEPYTGKAYPQLRGREIPGYWGSMPFTQSSEYMGIITIVLAILGIWFYRRDGFVISIFVLLIFSFLLALGSNFPVLYKALFLHLPYFSKFRVPSMILILINFIVIICSVYGLKGLAENFDNQKYKAALVVSGFFFLFGLFYILIPGGLSYTSAQDAQYMNNPQVLEMLRTARREFMQTDTLRMLAFIAGFITLLVLFKMKKIRTDLLIIGIILLIAIDLISISKRFLRTEDLVDAKSIERRYFAETQFDKILQGDPDMFRVLGLGSLFQSNDPAYRYQIVTGYSPIKPQRIQDIIDNNLMAGRAPDQLNWNVINMLNAKYIISPGLLNEGNLTLLGVDQQRKTALYLNPKALPRAFFVSELKYFSSEKEVVAFMNTAEFDPALMALICGSDAPATGLDVQGNIRIKTYTPNHINLEVETNRQAFLVLADAFYPVGWKARIDGIETTILPTNYVLRGIHVPPGRHEVEFAFKPHTYVIASRISNVSNSLIWLVLVGVIIFMNRDRIERFPIMQRIFAKKLR